MDLTDQRSSETTRTERNSCGCGDGQAQDKHQERSDKPLLHTTDKLNETHNNIWFERAVINANTKLYPNKIQEIQMIFNLQSQLHIKES